MKFGDWNITATTIEWSGDGINRFIINRQSLLHTIQLEGGEHLYKWIVQATEEEWLTHDGLYDLNFAFVFAAGASPGNFDYELFDKTLDYQFGVLEEEEEEDSET